MGKIGGEFQQLVGKSSLTKCYLHRFLTSLSRLTHLLYFIFHLFNSSIEATGELLVFAIGL